MEYISLEGEHTVESIREELARLVEQVFLTPLQGEAVEPERIAAFFRSELGRAFLAASERSREFKFSLLVPAGDYYPEAGEGEEILLQGVIDAWFDNGAGITVVDFKSDRIRPGEEARRSEEYRVQLESYSRAVESILGRPVTRKTLWFFATDRAVDL